MAGLGGAVRQVAPPLRWRGSCRCRLPPSHGRRPERRGRRAAASYSTSACARWRHRWWWRGSCPWRLPPSRDSSCRTIPRSATRSCPEGCALQVAPPLVVFTIVPPLPTAQPWLASRNETELSDAVVSEAGCSRWRRRRWWQGACRRRRPPSRDLRRRTRRSSAIRRARRAALPMAGCSRWRAVAGGEDRAAGAHGPAVTGGRQTRRRRVAALCRELRAPSGATVGRCEDRAVGAHDPAAARALEGRGAQILRRTRLCLLQVLPSSVVTQIAPAGPTNPAVQRRDEGDSAEVAAVRRSAFVGAGRPRRRTRRPGRSAPDRRRTLSTRGPGIRAGDGARAPRDAQHRERNRHGFAYGYLMDGSSSE